MDKKDLIKTLIYLTKLIEPNENGMVDYSFRMNINRRTKPYKLLKEVFEEFSEITFIDFRPESDNLHLRIYTKNPLDLNLLFDSSVGLKNYENLLNKTNLRYFRRFHCYEHSFYHFYYYLRIFIISVLQTRTIYDYVYAFFSLNEGEERFFFLRYHYKGHEYIVNNRKEI